MVMFLNRTGSSFLEQATAPLGFAAGDANLFRYVGNGPTNSIDPSGLAAVGHHWVPVSVLTDAGISRWLSMDAYRMGMGAYTGPTQQTHCHGTYGKVTHAEYNKIVKDDLDRLIKKNGGKTINEGQMSKFIDNLRNGNDHTGKPNAKIKSFNDAVAAERAAYVAVNPNARGFKNAQTPAQWKKQGEWYLEGSGSNRVNGKAVIKGAMIISAIGGWIVYDTPKAMACAADSPHFKNAVKSLSEGDRAGAERHLFGASNAWGSNCFYQELIDKVDPKFGMLFHEAYYQKLKEINERCENPEMRYTPSKK